MNREVKLTFSRVQVPLSSWGMPSILRNSLKRGTALLSTALGWMAWSIKSMLQVARLNRILRRLHLLAVFTDLKIILRDLESIKILQKTDLET